MRLLLVFAVTTTAACADSHAPAEGERCGYDAGVVDDTSTDHGLAAALAAASCSWALRCGYVFPALIYTDPPSIFLIDPTQACHPSQLRIVSDGFVDRPSGLRCLAFLQSGPCGADPVDCDGRALPTAYRRQVDGGPCHDSYECVSGRCSASGLPMSCGLCLPPADIGVDCHADSECAAPNVCVAQRCAVRGSGRIGDYCVGADACGSALVCEQYQCTPVLAVGADCTTLGRCGSLGLYGLNCIDGVCTPRGSDPQLGEPCNNEHAWCGPGLQCSATSGAGHCLARVGFGCGCTVDEECPAQGSCLDGRCQAYPDLGDSCGELTGPCVYGACVDGRCTLLPGGAACGGSSECASDTCYTTGCADGAPRGGPCGPTDACATGLSCSPSGICEPVGPCG